MTYPDILTALARERVTTFLGEAQAGRQASLARAAGAGLAGAAYVPQISHLVRARCLAGISRPAFEVWLLAALLTTARAVAIGAGVFIALGGIQIVATALILVCAGRYTDTPCPSHLPRQPEAKASRGMGTSGNGPVPGVRPVGWYPPQPHPPATAGHHARTSPSSTRNPTRRPYSKTRT